MNTNITPLQRKLLKHIAVHTERHGYQPSYREIAKEWGYRSAGYIQCLVSKLRDRGIVTINGARAVGFDYKKYLEEN